MFKVFMLLIWALSLTLLGYKAVNNVQHYLDYNTSERIGFSSNVH